jgi:hypothetical protein
MSLCAWKDGKYINIFSSYSENIHEIGDENDNQNKIYNNLKISKIKIIINITKSFEFNKNNYSLCAIITCPYNEHFSYIIINNNCDLPNLEKGCWYYYEDSFIDHNLRKMKDYNLQKSN